MDFQEKKGLTLIIVLVLIIAFATACGWFILLGRVNTQAAKNQNNSTRAFYLAEAGIERALRELQDDFENDPAPSWRDGDINGIEAGPDAAAFYELYPDTGLGDGAYSVLLKNTAKDDEIYVQSTGACGGITRTIQVFARAYNISPWGTAIFGGTGMGGVLINGNVRIAGSVHILGTGLGQDDAALSLSGGASILNNYSTIPAALSTRIPPCPTTTFNDEIVESLGATLRVKAGKVNLSGASTAGKPDVSGNNLKETLDGAYVTHRYGGNQGAAAVHSDNGADNDYDLEGLGDSVGFPELSEDFIQDLREQALVIAGAALADIKQTSNFTYTDGVNTIAMDGNGTLTINGIVYVEGGDFAVSDAPGKNAINYTGRGVIYVEGDANPDNGAIRIDTNFLTVNQFPTQDIIGFMTPGSITFDQATIDVMGAFYSESEIILKKQTSIAGTLVANYINMGSQVPSVYQVPSLIHNLPAGMINSDTTWVVVSSDWQEL